MHEINSVEKLRVAMIYESDYQKRQELLKLVTDEDFLTNILVDGSEEDQIWAINIVNSQDILKWHAINNQWVEVQRQALFRIEDQDFLKQRVIEENWRALRIAAMSRIKDQQFLYDIATSEEYSIVTRCDVIKYITDENLIVKGIIEWEKPFSTYETFDLSEDMWYKIYLETTKRGAKFFAIRHLQNINTLISIVSTSDDCDTRCQAICRLTTLKK